jgi:hypothetical protein
MANAEQGAPIAAFEPSTEARRLLVLVFGRRLEEAEAGLQEVEAALRHLAHHTNAGGAAWLQRAQAGVDGTRAALTGASRHQVFTNSLRPTAHPHAGLTPPGVP